MGVGPATRATFTVSDVAGPSGTLYYSDASSPVAFTTASATSGAISDALERARLALLAERVSRVASLASARVIVDRPAVDLAASQLQYLDASLREVVRAKAIAAVLEAVV